MVDMAIRTTKVETNVQDASGSPINVTVMVNYKVVDPVAASQFIEDVDGFVDTLVFDTTLLTLVQRPTAPSARLSDLAWMRKLALVVRLLARLTPLLRK
jgi:hypothetical protein